MHTFRKLPITAPKAAAKIVDSESGGISIIIGSPAPPTGAARRAAATAAMFATRARRPQASTRTACGPDRQERREARLCARSQPNRQADVQRGPQTRRQRAEAIR